MKPENSWIEDWKIGENSSRERKLGAELLKVFTTFWIETGLEGRSKTTIRRYTDALQALGGYLVEKGIFDEIDMSGIELLKDSINQYEGPLVHHHNEQWQDEIDMVSRKLYKFLVKDD